MGQPRPTELISEQNMMPTVEGMILHRQHFSQATHSKRKNWLLPNLPMILGVSM